MARGDFAWLSIEEKGRFAQDLGRLAGAAERGDCEGEGEAQDLRAGPKTGGLVRRAGLRLRERSRYDEPGTNAGSMEPNFLQPSRSSQLRAQLTSHRPFRSAGSSRLNPSNHLADDAGSSCTC
jgi:hypothetical protein